MKAFNSAAIVLITLPLIYVVTSVFPYPIHQITAAVFSVGAIYCVTLNWEQK